MCECWIPHVEVLQRIPRKIRQNTPVGMSLTLRCTLHTCAACTFKFETHNTHSMFPEKKPTHFPSPHIAPPPFSLLFVGSPDQCRQEHGGELSKTTFFKGISALEMGLLSCTIAFARFCSIDCCVFFCKKDT